MTKAFFKKINVQIAEIKEVPRFFAFSSELQL